MSKHMFYVAMSRTRLGAARASCVDEPNEKWGKQVVKEFYRENAGHEIRHVDGDEMVRLMNAGLAPEERESE